MPATGPARRPPVLPDPEQLGNLPKLNGARIAIDLGRCRGEFLSWSFYRPEPWRNHLHVHSFFEVC